MATWNLFILFFFFTFSHKINLQLKYLNTVKLGVGEPFDNIIVTLKYCFVHKHQVYLTKRLIKSHTNTKFDCTGQGATITSESPAPLPIFGYQNSGFIEDELDRF